VFAKIRLRLLLSYLMVLASILSVFAIAVRVVFTRSMTHQMTSKLKEFGQESVEGSVLEQGQLRILKEPSIQELMIRKQGLQWFTPQGVLLAERGKFILALPFSPQNSIQVQSGTPRLQGVLRPIREGNQQRIIGYVRASQSLAELDEDLQKLDWGLISGIVMALLLSGVGGVWLTRQAMEPIEASFQTLKQFTADASHELRSPLMAIKSNVSVALKYAEGMRPNDVEKFEAIASATTQMTHLTANLLMLARSDSNTAPKAQYKTVHLTALLQNLIQLHTAQAASQQLTLQGQLLDSLYVQGDEAQLLQLFTNLISNALHYTPPGGLVEVHLAPEGQMRVVTVCDTGIGIAPEHLARVFDRFWRADQSRQDWTGSLGLGLAIAQTIAQNHNGLISVTSQQGQGTCFTVRLPAK
jgi:two-component system, OmpR family, manganese sensing sensor histidine kinase